MRPTLLALALALSATACSRGMSGRDLDDEDADGFLVGEDCDDANAEVYPGAVERCNGADDDCDGEIDEGVAGAYYVDADGDGFGNADFAADGCAPSDGYVDNADDCDDLDDEVFPGAPELCDGVDNDCDGSADEGVGQTLYADADGDGYGTAIETRVGCEPGGGWTDNSDDCNDNDPATFPGAEERCDGVDEDCDGTPDNGLMRTVWIDADGDGYGALGSDFTDCRVGEGRAEQGGDCEDAAAAVSPAATEVCDGVDNNCDGETDEDLLTAYFQDGDGDLFGDAEVSQRACAQPEGFVANDDDCDDEQATTRPGAEELCDGADNDCDDQIDEGVQVTFYRDTDADGFGANSNSQSGCVLPSGFSRLGGDCDDAEPRANPAAAEICDGLDNDCDGDTDETGLSTWYVDADGDDFGDAATASQACNAPSADHVLDGTDCDDDDANNFPANAEACDDADNDCDGQVDEGVRVEVWADSDGDGYGDPDASSMECGAGDGWVDNADDCDDGDDGARPDANEVCDGVDNDCDDQVDEGVTVPLYTDADRDGYGKGFARNGCAASTGLSRTNDDCDDTRIGVNPGATEIPGDGIDQDCDGVDPSLSPGDVCFASDATLSLGAMVEGRLANGDQTGGPRGANYFFDDYELVLQQGKTYTLSANSEIIDAYLYVLDDQCRVVASIDDGAQIDFNSALRFTPTRTTVYTVVVTSWDERDELDGLLGYSGVGPYRLRVSEGDPGATCLSDTRVIGVGEDHQLLLSSSSPTNGPLAGRAYRDQGLYLEAGERISAQLISEDFPAYLALMDASCAVVASNDGVTYTDHARISYTAPSAGMYTLVAGTDTAGRTGTGRLQLARGLVGFQCPYGSRTGTLARSYPDAELGGSDRTTGGPLADGRYWEEYEVIASPSRGVAANVASPEVALYVEALDDQCAPISEVVDEDAHLGSGTAGLHATPSSWSEIVTFEVSAHDANSSGRYSLWMSPMGPWDRCGTDKRGLNPGETARDSLTSTDAASSAQTGGRWDDYELYMRQGEKVWLVADGPSANVGLSVLGSTCSVLASNLDSAAGDGAWLPFTAPSTGVYTVAVSSQSNTTGDYWLQAATENIAPKCGTAGEPIAPAGGTQTGDLAPTDPSGFRTTLGTHYHDDTLVFLERGQKLQAELTASFDTYLYLVSPSCQTVAQNDDISYPSNTNSRVEYTAPSTGVYTLRATSFSNGVSGAWTLTTAHVPGY